MPFARKQYKGKKKGYKKRYPNKKQMNNPKGGSTIGNIARIASTALSTAKFVAGLINPEFKYKDNSASLAVQTWTGSVSNISILSQGTSAVGEREGDSVKMKTLTMRFAWEYNSAIGANINDIVRIIIFIDKENSIANASDFLVGTGTNTSVFTPKNRNNLYKTKTLYDEHFCLDQYNPCLAKNLILEVPFHQRFQVGTGTAESNALKMILITQQPVNGSKFSYYSRLTYIDN